MPRQIVDVAGLSEILPLSVHQIYKLTRHREHPLPFKKMGKKLYFDVERIYRWFDSLPGQDGNFIMNE